ncbi:MAG TPA: HepT-like ribonuclease domain-containing protein [Burkholderiales bacterium]|nr:HepT-like ribonuclease domain-containing protein [Burkholderiales bacterium]
MARSPLDHLAGVLEAIDKIRAYTRGGESAFRKSSMARDAVLARLIRIGQAVKDAQNEGLDLPALAPTIAWRSIAGMRHRLVHKYWDADQAVVWGVVAKELEKLQRAVKSILAKERRRSGARSRPAKARLARRAGAEVGPCYRSEPPVARPLLTRPVAR